MAEKQTPIEITQFFNENPNAFIAVECRSCGYINNEKEFTGNASQCTQCNYGGRMNLYQRPEEPRYELNTTPIAVDQQTIKLETSEYAGKRIAMGELWFNGVPITVTITDDPSWFDYPGQPSRGITYQVAEKSVMMTAAGDGEAGYMKIVAPYLVIQTEFGSYRLETSAPDAYPNASTYRGLALIPLGASGLVAAVLDLCSFTIEQYEAATRKFVERANTHPLDAVSYMTQEVAGFRPAAVLATELAGSLNSNHKLVDTIPDWIKAIRSNFRPRVARSTNPLMNEVENLEMEAKHNALFGSTGFIECLETLLRDNGQTNS